MSDDPDSKNDQDSERAFDPSEIEDRAVKRVANYLESIGLERLARDISDEKIARRIVEGQMMLNDVIARSYIEERRAEELIERQLQISTKIFDQATSYNNFIVTIGYAGFFAIWNFLQEVVQLNDSALIGILLGVSILAFTSWVLINVIANMNHMTRVSTAFSQEHSSNEEKLEAIHKVDLRNQISAMRLMKAWHYFFVTALVSGFSAGIILLILLFSFVIGENFSIADWLDTAFDAALR